MTKKTLLINIKQYIGMCIKYIQSNDIQLMYIVHCAYSYIQCIMQNNVPSLYNYVQCTIYNVHCTLYSVQVIYIKVIYKIPILNIDLIYIWSLMKCVIIYCYIILHATLWNMLRQILESIK